MIDVSVIGLVLAVCSLLAAVGIVLYSRFVDGSWASAVPRLKWVGALVAVAVLGLIVFAGKSRPSRATAAGQVSEKLLARAVAGAEAGRLEAVVRGKVAREKADEKRTEVDKAVSEPDPEVRREKLATMLSSWGS